jgi:hypothetical protein
MQDLQNKQPLPPKHSATCLLCPHPPSLCISLNLLPWINVVLLSTHLAAASGALYGHIPATQYSREGVYLRAAAAGGGRHVNIITRV